MIEKPTVSIVLATYNGEKFILEQLNSLASQTYLPSELIVSDDLSADKTLDVVKQFSEKAPFPVNIVSNDRRLGYGENFLEASRRAKSKYVSFCDQDDIWLPEKLQVAVEGLENSQADLFVHAVKTIDHSGSITGKFNQGIKEKKLIPRLTLSPWGVFYGFSMTFRRDILDAIDPDLRGGHTFEFFGSLSHDLWIFFVAASLGNILVDPQHLALYRRHGANETPDLHGRFIQELSQWLGVSANEQLRRDHIAKHRSDILLDFHRSNPNHRLASDAKAASIYWGKIAQHEELRIIMHINSKIILRIFIFMKLMLGGAYRSYPNGGLGWRLSLKDASFSVFSLKKWMGKNYVR